MKNNWVRRIVLLVVGVALLGIGLASRGDSVSCGSTPMQPGDVCEHTNHGLPDGKYTYDQQKKYDSHDNTEMTIAGGVITVGALAWIVVGLVRPQKVAVPQPAAPIVITPGR